MPVATGRLGAALLYGAAVSSRVAAGFQIPDTFFDERTAPAIAYQTQQAHDPIARLNEALAAGSVTLTYESSNGYLPAVLRALHIPVESQLAVFSKTSVQARIISPENPRTLFFNDTVVVGWPRGGFIEAAAVDPELGVIFYNLGQQVSPTPRFERSRNCISCHLSSEATLSVPGMLLRSEATLTDGRPMQQLGRDVVDHTLPISKRWGGWYVTGRTIGTPNLGNVMLREPVGTKSIVPLQPIALTTLKDRFSVEGYLSEYSACRGRLGQQRGTPMRRHWSKPSHVKPSTICCLSTNRRLQVLSKAAQGSRNGFRRKGRRIAAVDRSGNST